MERATRRVSGDLPNRGFDRDGDGYPGQPPTRCVSCI